MRAEPSLSCPVGILPLPTAAGKQPSPPCPGLVAQDTSLPIPSGGLPCAWAVLCPSPRAWGARWACAVGTALSTVSCFCTHWEGSGRGGSAWPGQDGRQGHPTLPPQGPPTPSSTHCSRLLAGGEPRHGYLEPRALRGGGGRTRSMALAHVQRPAACPWDKGPGPQSSVSLIWTLCGGCTARLLAGGAWGAGSAPSLLGLPPLPASLVGAGG